MLLFVLSIKSGVVKVTARSQKQRSKQGWQFTYECVLFRQDFFIFFKKKEERKKKGKKDTEKKKREREQVREEKKEGKKKRAFFPCLDKNQTFSILICFWLHLFFTFLAVLPFPAVSSWNHRLCCFLAWNCVGAFYFLCTLFIRVVPFVKEGRATFQDMVTKQIVF